MTKRLVALGFTALMVGSAWGEPPQGKESPADRAKRFVTVVDKDVRWVWPDGREGTFHVFMKFQPPAPHPFTPEKTASNPNPPQRDLPGLDPALKRARNLPESRAADAASRGYDAFGKQQYKKSENEYNEAIRLEPKEPDHYANRAMVRLILGENDQAIKDLTGAIELNPKKAAKYYSGRATVWYTLNQSDKAFTDVNDAIRLDPNSAFAYYYRACFRTARGDFDGALADFDETIRIEPNNASLIMSRFFILVLKRDTNAAIFATEEMIHRSSTNEQAIGWFSRMLLLAATGDLDQALWIGDSFVTGNPNNAGSWGARGLVLLRRKEYDRAKSDYDNAIRLAPKSSEFYVPRAMAWEGKHEYRQALADLDAALRIAPDNLDASHERAWLLATCPDPSVRDGHAALDSARRCVLSQKVKDPLCLDTLAAAEADQGDFESAIRTEQEAIALAKDHGAKFVRDARRRLALYQTKRPYRDNGQDEDVPPAPTPAASSRER